MALTLLALSGCAFDYDHSITPMVWYTPPPQNVPNTPALQTPIFTPFPTPTLPFSVTPPPPAFRGIDSLDCMEPMEGDNQYGYCRGPGSDKYYVWGRCEASCPDGPYPGIEIFTVEHSDTFFDYKSVIDELMQETDDMNKSFRLGGGLGSLGVAGGIVGITETCITAGAFTGGWAAPW
ncbi:MAG: hypothetical protein A2Z14_01180 [Chloroflexi bacterium RBG_16_48_8]|nr:MAG: hypothetical protein A2Z14_01180 [Chloroflexi bacterium RBG_16_48_8]